MHFNLGGMEMEVCKKWTVQMKNNISGGAVMPPVLDPFDSSVFYVSDGWYSYYSSIRLRRLSVETGEELSNVLTRDCVRCIHVEAVCGFEQADPRAGSERSAYPAYL